MSDPSPPPTATTKRAASPLSPQINSAKRVKEDSETHANGNGNGHGHENGTEEVGEEQVKEDKGVEGRKMDLDQDG